jgi:hypothetical protein
MSRLPWQARFVLLQFSIPSAYRAAIRSEGAWNGNLEGFGEVQMG